MPALTICFSLAMWAQAYPKSGYLLRLNQGCKVPLLLFVSSLKLTGKVSKKNVKNCIGPRPPAVIQGSSSQE